ncbi:MAG: PAS domain S-box protein, partial [Deltaproteobacteria bacterium]|nr:PAS domain S-box protein [Deltaproteobacteria bacterium]
SDVLKWLLAIIGAACGIVLLFIFWNRSLTVKVRERTVELESSNRDLAAEISERTEAETALRENRDYLKNLTDSMPDAVFSVKMPDRKIEWVNDAFQVLGYEPGECIGRTTEFLYPSREEFGAFGDKILIAIAEGKRVLQTEQNLRKKSGEVFPAEINVSLFVTNGKLISATAIVRNIAERKKAEDALKNSEEKFRLLVEQSPLSIQIFDGDGRVIQVNEAWKALWGISDEMLPEVLEKYNVLEDDEARRLGILPHIEKAFMGRRTSFCRRSNMMHP